MTYKVWLLTDYSDGDSDIEHVLIESDNEQDIKDMIESMGSDVIAFVRLREGVDVSEGLERTSLPSPLSPSLCEVLL